MPKQVPPGE